MNLDRAVEFLANIDEDVVIFGNDDGDGVCSSAILLAYFRERRIKPDLFFGGYDIKTLESFAKRKNKFVIFVDSAIDQYIEIVKALKKSKVMVIDHHVITNDLNKIGVVHINPRFERPNFYVSASHITWDICRKAGLKGYSFLGRLGDVSDRAIKGNKLENEAAFIISAIEAIDKSRFEEVARNLSGMDGLETFVYNPKYQRLKERLSTEIRLQLENIEPLLSNDIVFFEMESKLSLPSILSSMLLDRYPDKTFLIYKKTNDSYHISGRSKTINLVKAFKKACKGIGKGGGHPVASGAEIKDINLFRKRFLEYAIGKGALKRI